MEVMEDNVQIMVGQVIRLCNQVQAVQVVLLWVEKQAVVMVLQVVPAMREDMVAEDARVVRIQGI
jgi:hypothetical protein